jgi:hypothetical protein
MCLSTFVQQVAFGAGDDGAKLASHSISQVHPHFTFLLTSLCEFGLFRVIKSTVLVPRLGRALCCSYYIANDDSKHKSEPLAPDRDTQSPIWTVPCLRKHNRGLMHEQYMGTALNIRI